MQRIAIIGSGGAGKSTLARKIGKQLQIEVVHLDRLFWKPDWVMSSREEQKALYQPLISQTTWIIDGNYGATMDIRLQEADTVIYLDFPRMLCIYRVLKRRFQYHKQSRPDMADGCLERLDFTFLKWLWNYSKNNRPLTLEKLAALPDEKRVIILRNPKDVERFLASIGDVYHS